MSENESFSWIPSITSSNLQAEGQSWAKRMWYEEKFQRLKGKPHK